VIHRDADNGVDGRDHGDAEERNQNDDINILRDEDKAAGEKYTRQQQQP
jgi:hypothetical protein